jgi:hypothetical protein
MPRTRDVMLAEFDRVEPVLAAIRQLRDRGVADLDVYSPYPVVAIEQQLGIRRSRIPFFAFGAAVLGGGFAYWLQWFMNAWDYPLNVGGRPPHMAPAFVPVTFEMAVLACAITAFLAVLVRAGLPRLWDPVFEVEGFERASVDRLWLALGAATRASDEELAQVLHDAGALRIVGYE